MAYAAVASLSQTIDIVLNHHHDSISPQFKNQIIYLHKHIIFFQSFLEDAPDRANNWEEEIREVTDMAEDIIELLLSDSLLESTVGSSNPKYGKVSFDELERVTEEIESVASRVKGGRRIEAAGGSDDKELMEIISRLRGGSSSLETIAIVGMGGMGKTTLARNAYNHPLIEEHFFIRAWATISTDSVMRRIISDLLRSINKSNCESESYSSYELIKSLLKILRGKRYLIVLDNMQNLDALEALKIVLPDHENGSRIIFTTRLSDLAQAAAHTHKMRFLDEDKTWDLLRAKIFKGDPCPSQLESMGKMIARSCRGHPLSIDVVLGVLSAADQSEAAWEDISENIKIASDDYDDDDVIINILCLSYRYLPHHLRSCFLYLASFPEDHEIYVSELIKLWVAEGFLNESEGKSFEETGEECVEDLVRRSLESVSKRKSDGRIKSITIHDIMWELCLIQAEMDNFILHVRRIHRHIQATKLQSCRRVSSSIYVHDFLKDVYGSTIRTIMLYSDDSKLGIVIWWSIGNVRLLRILDLSKAYNYYLPEEVFELFHLRYLAFHSGFIISRAISNLENLQTLMIYPRDDNGGISGELPEGIWRMPHLRHLLVFCSKLPTQKGAMPALENLQTVSRLLNFVCSRDNLKMIPNLKKLALIYTQNLGDVVEDYELHNLIYLQKLEILKIEMDWSFGEQHEMSCAFPSALKKLSLSGVGFSWEDMEIVGSLPNLQVLKLRKHA